MSSTRRYSKPTEFITTLIWIYRAGTVHYALGFLALGVGLTLTTITGIWSFAVFYVTVAIVLWLAGWIQSG